MREEPRERGEELVEFLKTKRWFGEKGRDIRDAALRDVIAVVWPGSKKTFAVARAAVTTDAGQSTYQLFSQEGKGKKFDIRADALDDEEFLRGLADVWQLGATFERDGTRWTFESEGKAPLVVPLNAPIMLSSAEQTNSSVIMNREAILKLYRKLEPGIHPDVEVTRFLTIERQFMHVPVMLGTVRFEDTQGVTIAGMLQEYVQGAIDGWAYAQERLRAHLASGDAPFEEDAEQLGTVTRALHETLASGDAGSEFELQPATGDSVLRWERNAADTVEAGLQALERAVKERKIPKALDDVARAIADHRPRITARMRELAAGIADDAGANTRTHGDLHLGQVLRSAAAQFLIIDFEGEPTRPLRERRARHSPLRDVAGMLRSFAYAAAESGERASEWESSARSAFLRGYLSEKNGRAGLLPRAQSNADRLLRLFEVEKAFYELQYELDHRPDWVWIPLRGINQLFA